jgi:cobalamin biosynthesis Mg chelatase CobN
MKIVKVRRRKILDGSGSMIGGGLGLQQLIEVLENKVTAEKQQELDLLSQELDRDLRLETETWQFGVTDNQTGADFRRLKKLSPTFDEVEQALTWYMSGEAAGGTNDYDPLETIYGELLAEDRQHKIDAPTEASPLERIKAGFCVRELKNLEELESKDPEELTGEEKIYLRNLQAAKDSFEKYLEELNAKFENVEAIVEVIEVTTDGGSNDPARVQKIIKKLRSLGVIVIAYGLGGGAQQAESTYANKYNPMEGGKLCINLLDYPTTKEKVWRSVLDKV